GCLNVMAGLEVMRRIASEGKPPVTVRLVDWADEEGARFGRSLFGSSACSGTMNPDELRNLVDKDGIRLVDAIGDYDIDLDQAKQSHRQLTNAAAYLELHIEQGPVLESMDLPLGVVLGTFGVERHAIRFTGQAAHSGSTPMDKRKDALGAASKLALEIREIAKRNGGVCTVGRMETKPGIVTSVVAQADMTLDQRHLEATALAKMYQEAQDASKKFAEEEKVGVEWNKIWDIHPILFHPDLIELCAEAVQETSGTVHRLPSGPLHDAAEVARAGVPTIMMFVQSLYGISHNKIEDTKEEHIAMSVVALDKLASKTMQWILAQK
ncbi:MAG TPA: hydantoinase/carbamoylase family amidase, partial [Phototrophicaceae bacterium]|nr:hydantoinase/carbamoylase family amidase [Phototrophicaceae bacterium]